MKEDKDNFLDAVNKAKQRLAAGESLDDVFDWYDEYREGFTRVVLLNDKWNYINRNGDILSDMWFDYCDEFHEGFARVLLNDKWNYINRNGDIMSATWFVQCQDFRKGLAAVAINDKWNFIDSKGKYLSDIWFNDCGIFREGFAWVELNDKYNYIDTKGEYLSYIWFDWCGHFHDGLAQVGLNGIDHLLRNDGILCDYNTKEPVKLEEQGMMEQEKTPYSEDEIKAMVKTIQQLRKDKKELIEKACEWLKDRTMKELCLASTDSELVDEFIETFREAMEE